MRKMARRTCAQHRTEVLLLKSRRRRTDLMRRNAELLEGIEMANGLVDGLRQRKEAAEYKLAEVLRMLPRHSLLEHPIVQHVNRMLGPGERFRVEVDEQTWSPTRGGFFDTLARTLSVVELERIVQRVRVDEHAMHLILTTPDGTSAYVMNWSSVDGLTKDQLAYLLHKNVVPELVQHAVKTVFHGRRQGARG